MAPLSDDGPRVLVTGATGFTGAYLTAALRERGYAVATPPASFDLVDAEAVHALLARLRPEFILHLAAISFVPHAQPAALYAVNAVGTVNLLEAAERSGAPLRKILLASSANVYGNAGVERIDESVPPAPVNHYACSKLAMEHMARTWFNRLPIILVRPFNYIGPGQSEKFLIPKIVDHYARRAARISLGNTDVARDFSDVRMVVEAYCRLLESPFRSGTLNICSGVARSLDEILRTLERISGHAVEVEVDPTLVRANEVKRLTGSPDRLIETVGALPFLDFENTLRWMLQNRLQELSR